MKQVAHSGLFWTQFRVSRDSFIDLTTGKATVRTIIPRLFTAANRIRNCSYRKLITYQTPQSNLPSIERADWQKLHDMFIAGDATSSARKIAASACAFYLLFVNIFS